MAADLSRYDDVPELLASLPRTVPALQVAVVNGSAVTGGWDEHSDLDVEAWCSGDAATTYDAVLARLRDALPVDSLWELPETTWPNGRQCFVHLHPDAADLSRPTRLLDLVIQTTPELLTMDTRRHGTPMVLHDPRPVRLRAALPAHRSARRVRGAGGSTAARARPGGPDPGSVRVAGRSPGHAHFTKQGVSGGFHHSPL